MEQYKLENANMLRQNQSKPVNPTTGENYETMLDHGQQKMTNSERNMIGWSFEQQAESGLPWRSG